MNQKIQSPEMLKSIGAVYLAQQAGFTRRVLVSPATVRRSRMH